MRGLSQASVYLILFHMRITRLPADTRTMNFLETIPHLASAGAMGVSLVCLFKVYGLLTKEQEQENPRPVFLRSIYIFMGFGLLMTLVALGIEVSRYFMPSADGELTQLKEALRGVREDNFYSLDSNGNPDSIHLNMDGAHFLLSAAFPDTSFGETPLHLVQRAGKYRAVKNNSGAEITYGYFPDQELKGKLASFFSFLIPTPLPPSPKPVTDVETLFAAGMGYTPAYVRNELKLRSITDLNKANRRLVDFLSAEGSENEALREEAVKLLMQPRMMDKLSEEGHDRLIELLSTNDVRIVPWRYYEAAQVYFSRYHLKEKTVSADLEKHLELSRDYLKAFKNKGWTASNHPGEYSYYRSAALALGYRLDCDTCLLSEEVRLK